MSHDPRVDAYIAARAGFAQPILTEIRARLHAAAELTETIKWSMPFFEYRGHVFANMAAFKAHASFGFWRRDALPTGQEGDAMGQFGRLTTVDDLPDRATFADLVRAAIAVADAGPAKVKPADRPAKPPLGIPAELAAAMAGDTLAAATFAAFPPSCQREYCEWIGRAKRQETRDRRTAEAIAWLREGKRRHWKYENC